jgi:small subunit ribosomal protein S1
MLANLKPGDIIKSNVTHLEQFGAFVDVGCGVASLLSIDCISVSRISHPKDRFSVGDSILCVVKKNDEAGKRIFVTHKELLGTWEENAAEFTPGQTVTGIVRSIEDYGIFIELAPNLAGLAEYKDNIKEGQIVSVFIKSIIPERMKIKLVIIDSYPAYQNTNSQNYKYFLDDGNIHIDTWKYSPEISNKWVETVFD